jgi:DNA-binding response OmpR family regulator
MPVAAKKEVKKKILIGEDERPMAQAMMLKLTRAGYAVTTASNGEEVMEYLLKNKYDLLLLDIMMPKKDGFTVLREMKEKKHSFENNRII